MYFCMLLPVDLSANQVSLWDNTPTTTTTKYSDNRATSEQTIIVPCFHWAVRFSLMWLGAGQLGYAKSGSRFIRGQYPYGRVGIRRMAIAAAAT